VVVKLYADLVAVDPEGGFVIYTSPLGCSNDILMYQALDSAGNPAGAAKPLVPCGTLTNNIQGIDILKDGSSYWLSFGGSDPAVAKYLMKIDAAGKVLTQPKAVVPAGKVGSVVGATALQANGKKKLFLVYVRFGRHWSTWRSWTKQQCRCFHFDRRVG
jgi:hypothetical protein